MFVLAGVVLVLVEVVVVVVVGAVVEVVTVVRVVGVVVVEVDVVGEVVAPPSTGTRTSWTLMQNRLGSFSGFEVSNGKIRLRGEHTGIAGWIVPELVGVPETRTNTDPATRRSVLLPDKIEVYLDCVRLWVTRPRGLEKGAGITTLRHEHLDGVVNFGVLFRQVSFAYSSC